MAVSRRRLLGLAGASVAAAAVDVGGLLTVFSAPASADAAPAVNGRGLFGGMTTLDRTVQQAQRQDVTTWTDYVKLVPGTGEPHLMLRPADFTGIGFRQPTRVLDAFAHITDMHLIDDQSPGRLEFTDRWADLNSTINNATSSAYRPHEMMSLHIAEAMVRAIRDVAVGPITGLPFAFTINTGDMTDNLQQNEVRWYIDLLDGGKAIRADSGDIGVDESVSGVFGLEVTDPGHGAHDKHYWSPDGREENGTDLYRLTYAFPLKPGLLAAARQPFMSTGLGMPWYAAMGNHDGEIQGNYPLHPGDLASIFDNLSDVSGYATGDQKPYDSFTTSGEVTFPASGPDQINDLNAFLQYLKTVTVTADGDRVMLNHDDFVKQHMITSGTPVGHGFRIEQVPETIPVGDGQTEVVQVTMYRTYYTWASTNTSLIQYITLDTVGYSGNSDGHLDSDQFVWLEAQLRANSSFYYDTSLNPVHQSGVTDKLFVLFGHHTIDSLTNSSNPLAPGITRQQIELLLLRYPNVILYVCGHTHENEVHEHARSSTTALGNTVPGVGGFWEVATASHIDWPVQSRVIEIAAGKGMLSIFNTVVDIAAPLDHGGDLSTPTALASLARELAANDPTERPGSSFTAQDPGGNSGRRGTTHDRNTLLTIPAPFPIAVPDVWGSSIALALNADGRLELLGTKPDDGIWQRFELAAGSDTWDDWTNPDGHLRAVAVETAADNRVMLAGTNGSGEVFVRTAQQAGGAAWNNWLSLGNVNARSVALARNADGHMEIFVTTAGFDVWHVWQSTAGGSWGSWSAGFGQVGQSFVQVAAASNSNGLVEVFALSDAGELWHRAQISTGGWTFWTSLGNLPVACFSKVAVAQNSDGRLTAFAIDHDRRVWFASQTSAGAGTWGSWSVFDGGGTRMTQITGRKNTNGLIELIALDHAGQLWSRRQQSADAAVWGAWAQFWGTLRQDVPVVPSSSFTGEQVIMPNLIGLDQAFARTVVQASGLTLVEPGSVHNILSAGTVCHQTTPAGTGVPEGTAVSFTVSLGGVAVPSLFGRTERVAKAALVTVGLVAHNAGFITVPDPSEAGLVADQDPPANSVVGPGTTVSYSIGQFSGVGG